MASTVTRSPNYPGLSLPDALRRVEAVYDKNHMHAVPKEVVAKALGYAGLNGKSKMAISALLKYGLLISRGGDLAVSEDALSILFDPKKSPSRLQAIEKAAFLPSLWEDLHAAYGDEPPGDDAIKSFLVKRGFNPNTVSGVIAAYRATLDFVDESDREQGSAIRAEHQTDATAPSTAKTSGTPSTPFDLGSLFGKTETTPGSSGGAPMTSIPIPLAADRAFIFQAPFPLSDEDWQFVEQTLKMYRTRLTIKPKEQEEVAASGETQGSEIDMELEDDE